MSQLPVSPQPSMTIEEFEERLHEGDRWIELVDGRLSRLNPPDDAHGDVVRNLARALATFLRKSNDTNACFELPLIISRENGGTILCPAVSFFRFSAGNRFAETDKVLTDTRPVLVIEVASTNERRQSMLDHVQAYQAWGVNNVWVVDPVVRQVQRCYHGIATEQLDESHSLSDQALLPGFSMPVSELFREPTWMKSKSAPV